MIKFRQALELDASVLSKLAFESKAYWGYSDEFMAACRDELTLSPEECKDGHVVVAYDESSTILGFYSITGPPPQGNLEDLFVSPAHIGHGLGGILLRHAATTAKKAGMTSLEIHSDPHAKDFYIHMGAMEQGTAPSSSITGRSLPKLILNTPS